MRLRRHHNVGVDNFLSYFFNHPQAEQKPKGFQIMTCIHLIPYTAAAALL
jgi:hypothetical protein